MTSNKVSFSKPSPPPPTKTPEEILVEKTVAARRTFRTRVVPSVLIAGTCFCVWAGIAYESTANIEPKGWRPPVDEKLRQTPTADLVRTLAVYSACQIPWVVDHSPRILKTMSSLPVLGPVAENIVRHTFFYQFVAGETADEYRRVIRALRKNDIGCLLAYSVEVAHEESEAAAGLRDSPDFADHVDSAEVGAARRRAAREHIDATIESIEVAGEENRAMLAEEGGAAKGETGSTWVAVKLTGLMPDPSALHRFSNSILALPLAQRTSTSATVYPGTPADSAIALLSSSPEYAPMLPSVEHGVTPTDMDDLRALYGDLRQVIGTARTQGVRVIIDAEHTWFQPAVDAFQTVLSAEFNKLPSSSSVPSSGSRKGWLSRFISSSSIESSESAYPLVQPIVYGTYQTYLRRTPDHLDHSLRRARANGYALGVKLVRGAYHDQETARWAALNRFGPPPVWETKAETDACYDGVVDRLLDLVREDVESKTAVPRIAALFGTHNKASVGKLVAGLVKRGLADPVSEEEEKDEKLKGRLRVGEEVRKRIAVGQLYGMSDALTNATAQTFVPGGAPLVLKYVPWGNLEEVMSYLGRRAIENKSVLSAEGGASAECARAWRELKWRWFGLESIPK